MSPDTRRVHYLDGVLYAGGRIVAVCHCGETTTPRVDEAHATKALATEHGSSRFACALCDREYPSAAGLVVVPVPDPRPTEPVEFWTCRDFTTCGPLARERQAVLDQAAALTLVDHTTPSPEVDPGPPALRLIRGGKPDHQTH